MRIAPSPRVVYQNNPLAEVVCQIRFERSNLQEDALAALRGTLAGAGYSNTYTEETAQITVRVSAGEAALQKDAPPPRVHHFAAPDQALRVSASSQFIALTCTRYESWAAFKPRMLDAVALFVRVCGPAPTSRIGLRYKDVIAREPLGLEGVPWSDLLAPFVLGPLARTDLTLEGAVPELDVESFAFQSSLRLEDCKLLLQGGLLFTLERDRTAFLVDSDFFVDDAPDDLLSSAASLDEVLERLHKSAGALFSKTILRRLHDALKPVSG
jgi:uncharacterized protein (TIGR04255 family)